MLAKKSNELSISDGSLSKILRTPRFTRKPISGLPYDIDALCRVREPASKISNEPSAAGAGGTKSGSTLAIVDEAYVVVHARLKSS